MITYMTSAGPLISLGGVFFFFSPKDRSNFVLWSFDIFGTHGIYSNVSVGEDSDLDLDL